VGKTRRNLRIAPKNQKGRAKTLGAKMALLTSERGTLEETNKQATWKTGGTGVSGNKFAKKELTYGPNQKKKKDE